MERVAGWRKIYIVNEHEPESIKFNMNVQVQMSIYLIEDGVQVSQLNSYSMYLNPDSDVPVVYADMDKRLQESQCPPMSDSVKARISNILDADQTELVKLQWRDASKALADLSLHKESRMHIITIQPNGTIKLGLKRCLCDNGITINPCVFHSVTLEPGDDTSAMLARTNDSLAMLDDEHGPYPPMSQDIINRVQRIVAIEHTPEAIAASRAARAWPA